MLLAGRTAIVHGADAVVGVMAAALECAGATVFCAGGDPLDEPRAQAHAESVVAAAGGIDIAVVVPVRDDVGGIPLLDRTVADVVRPAVARLASAFIGARVAARLMSRQGSGVVVVLDDDSDLVGAAVAALVPELAAELAPRGVRCASVRCASVGCGAPGDAAAAVAAVAEVAALLRPRMSTGLA